MSTQRVQKLDVLTKIFLNLVDRLVSFEHDNPELGKLAVRIITYLAMRNEALPEDKIASALGIEGSEVRKVLHTLFKYALIEVEKEAVDPERGRYENRLRISPEFVRRITASRIRMVIDVLKECLQELATTAYYVCPTCYRRYTMDEAYDLNFRCPRDDTPLVQPDHSVEVEFLTEVIKKLQDYCAQLSRSGK